MAKQRKYFCVEKFGKKQIVESLSRLPEAFQKLGAFEVIKFDKSKDFPNPASNVRDDKIYIAIYNSLFSNDYSIDRVLVHEFAHQYYRSMPLADVQSYQLSTNWFMDTKNLNKVIGQRSMGFVTEDSLSAPEEDFANNLEYYLILPEVLKSKYSPAYNWIRENIPNIKMQEGCKYEN